MSVTVVDADNKNIGLHHRRPDHRRQLDTATTAAPWRSPPATPRAGPTEVMVDADTADKHHLKLGDELRTIAVTGDFTREDLRHRRPSQVTNPGAAIVYFDTATAQRNLLGDTGVYTNVNVTAAAGVSDAPAEEERRRRRSARRATSARPQKEAADASREDDRRASWTS